MPNDTDSSEWIIMYRQGLPVARIAELCGVKIQAVKRAIDRALRLEPELEQEHQARTQTPTSPISAAWRARSEELAQFISSHGRPPFGSGHGPLESSLGRWLAKQRAAALKGELTEEKRRALDQAGDWEKLPRAHLDAQRWNGRLVELEGFVSRHARFPSYRAASTHERVLGTWLHTQRQSVSRGKISPGQLQALHDRVPGWDTWRRQP